MQKKGERWVCGLRALPKKEKEKSAPRIVFNGRAIIFY